MKSSSLTHLVWGLVAVVAFMGGYAMTDHGASTMPAGTKATATSAAADKAEENSTADDARHKAADASAPKGLSHEEARVRTFQALAETSRFDRMHALCEVLAGLSKDNWHDFFDAFVLQTTKTGRTHDEEWDFLMARIGEMAGADALGVGGLRGREMDTAFSAFASRDSKGAIAWFNAQPAELQQGLLGRLLSGVAQSDPKQALALALAQPPQLWAPAIRDMVAGAVQYGGLPAAEEMLESIQSRPDVPDALKSSVFFEIAQRKANAVVVDHRPADALAWFDRYIGPNSPADPNATRLLVSRAAAGDGAATLSWIDARLDRLSDGQAAAAYVSAAQAFERQAPGPFGEWMQSHANHPQHDSMTVAVVNSLLDRNENDQAAAWAGTIRDTAQLAQLNDRLKRHGVALTQ